MLATLLALLQVDFLPHGWCYRWVPWVVSIHVVSDLLIAMAYYFIPFSLIYIVRRRRDLVYPWMFVLFGAFILLCGTTHVMSVFLIWWPWYEFDGVLKLITAFASIGTAILMIRIAPAAVALPSPAELKEANLRLGKEIVERQAAEREVRNLNAELELRVQERTQELEQVNQQLRESENRLRAILDSSPALVYLKDLQGRYLFANHHFETTLGISREQAIGQTDHDLFPADLADAYRSADTTVTRETRTLEVEELASQAGELRTFSSLKFPLLGESGKVYAICGISTDITERKKNEDELRRYNAELEQFAYVVSHDLQEPLRTVKSYVQLLAKRYRSALDADADEFIGYVVGGVNRMHDLINALQAFGELNRPRGSGPAISDSGAVLASTLQHMQTTIEVAGARVVSGEMPTVRVPTAHLGQVFQNLVSNAIKYARPGLAPEIQVSAQKLGPLWEFVVRDNGIGLEMKYAEQIFGVFRRLHGQEVPGTGIGLAICKKVVESAGGRIWVVSELNQGAAFHFTLPAA